MSSGPARQINTRACAGVAGPRETARLSTRLAQSTRHGDASPLVQFAVELIVRQRNPTLHSADNDQTFHDTHVLRGLARRQRNRYRSWRGGLASQDAGNSGKTLICGRWLLPAVQTRRMWRRAAAQGPFPLSCDGPPSAPMVGPLAVFRDDRNRSLPERSRPM